MRIDSMVSTFIGKRIQETISWLEIIILEIGLKGMLQTLESSVSDRVTDDTAQYKICASKCLTSIFRVISIHS